MTTYTVATDGDGADPGYPPLTVHDVNCPVVDGSQDWAVEVEDLVELCRTLFGYTGTGDDQWMRDISEAITIMPCTALPIRAPRQEPAGEPRG